ncbi:MAG: MarR family transcriptional regulator [Alphaproteobacteria bacterium]|nr:MarR family transcriptional regulator [Alphaproteobacteria bacterium]
MPASARDLTAIFDRNEIPDTYRISFLANSIIVPVYDGIKRDVGLNRGEYLLLFCLAHFAELTAQDVANMSGRPRNSISRGVHRMVAQGYIDRSPDKHDGRQAWLSITEQGRALHVRLVKRFKDREDEVLNGLNAAQRTQLSKLLQKLVLHTSSIG